MSRYRFARQPKWILSHLFVLALVVAMIGACFWQLDRRQEKQARNERIEQRSTLPVVGVETLADIGDFDAVGDLEFREVTASGTYAPDQDVLIRSRSRDGAPGAWVLSVLDLDSGGAVVVNRGWIPNSGQLTEVPDEFRAPTGPVTVEGQVRQTETRGSFGPTDPSTGTLSNLARADVARIDAQVPAALLPLVVQMASQRPAIGEDAPRPVPPPTLDEGPHLGYAAQWAIFAAIALVGYPLILRRRARELEREAALPDLDGPDPDDHPEPGDPRLSDAAR